MELDPLLLSRLQFAFVVCFHAIFPVFTIGLATFIAFLEMLAFRTGNPAWSRLSQFWIQVFAVAFAMGVVSGIVMSFQFRSEERRVGRSLDFGVRGSFIKKLVIHA